MSNHTIIAIATASGRGGIGVVRLSGRHLSAFAQAWLGQALTPRHAHYLPFPDASGVAIDRGIALFFPAPHSYTGEDVLELQGHGGPMVLQRLVMRAQELAITQQLPLRMAQPGEFTQRAYLNGKMDLAQAEAVADLIEAATLQAAQGAAASLSGAFSNNIHALVQSLIALRTLVEATLDFPEEEIEFLQQSNALQRLADLRVRVEGVFASACQGALLRDGLKVVLVGAPNVGKSSLLNALTGRERAIVTPIAGTTRDTISEAIQIEGIPLHIIDTAGLRESHDEVERIGIARAWAEIESADVVLHVCDARDLSMRAAPLNSVTIEKEGLKETTEDAADAALWAAVAARAPSHAARRTIVNKIDLLENAQFVDAASDALLSETTIETTSETANGTARTPPDLNRINQKAENKTLYISAKHQQGLAALRAELLNIAGWQASGEGVFLARARHIAALQTAQAHLSLAQAHGAQGDAALDLFAEELRLAQNALSSITGEFSSDDLLGEIFGKFCIGK